MVSQVSMACLQREQMLNRIHWSGLLCERGVVSSMGWWYCVAGEVAVVAGERSFVRSRGGSTAGVVTVSGVQGQELLGGVVAGGPGVLALGTVQARTGADRLAFGMPVARPRSSLRK